MTIRGRRVSARTKRTPVGLVTEPTEGDIQEALFQWMQGIYVTIGQPPLSATRRLDTIAFMVPNGLKLAGTAKQRAIYMASLKRKGFKPGVSDVIIPLPVGPYHGMFLELKRDKRSPVSEEQKEFSMLMLLAGYQSKFGVGLEAAKQLILDYVAPVSRVVGRRV